MGLGLQMVRALLTSLLSPFFPLFLCAPTLLQAPEPRRKQSPRLASPQWPRPGWHSSRIAVGPPSAISCSPPCGVPPGPRGLPLPSTCLHSPHFTGALELSKAEGVEGKPVTAAGAVGAVGGPSRPVQSVAIGSPSPSHGPPQSMPNPGVCLTVYPNHQERSFLKKVYLHFNLAVSNPPCK